MLGFLLFYRKTVFVNEIGEIFWFHLKTENFSVHKEYSDLQEGFKEFTMLALQAFFSQEDARNMLVAEATGASKIILTTRSSNLNLSGNLDKSCVGYELRDFCKEPLHFDEWQAELKKCGCAKKRLDIISPDGKSVGKRNFYAEIIPNTELYFCKAEPLVGITNAIDKNPGYCIPLTNF